MPDATQLVALGAAFVAGELALAVAVGRLLARGGHQTSPHAVLDVTPHTTPGAGPSLAPVLDLARYRALRPERA